MTNWNTAVCTANGINIHYTRTGGDKPALVLLHGLAANGACWTSVAHFLEKEYDIIMPDARGHGESSKPGHGYSYEDLANDVIGLINALRLPPTLLLGHSMGGMTAALAARLCPKLLRGLVLADPTFLSPKVQREVFDSNIAGQHRRILGQPLETLVADLKSRHPYRSPDTLERIARARLQTSMAAFGVLTPPNPDYRQIVSAIDVPGLLVFGDKGVITPLVAEELQRLNPRFQVASIPEASHGLHYDQPERFAAVTGSFMRSIGTVIDSSKP